MIKQWLKIFAIAGIFLLGILFIGFAALRKMFPPEKIKEMLIQTASEKLKREIRLGETKIGLFSGIEVHDFALSETPNFKQGSFLQSEKFLFKFQLLPLLKKKVVIDELELLSPQIRIVQNPDGKSFNFSDLIEPSTAPSKLKAQTEEALRPTPLSLTISKLKIAKGKIEWIDRSPKKIQLAAHPIDLSFTGTGLDKPMRLDFTVGMASQWQGKKIAGEIKSKIVVDLKAERLQFDSLECKMAEADLMLKGKIAGFRKPELDLVLDISEISLQKLASWVSLPKGFEISGSPHLGLALKGSLEDLFASASLELSDTAIGYQELFQKPRGTGAVFVLKAKLKKQKDLIVESLQANLGSLELTSTGELQNLGARFPSVKMEIQTNRVDLKQLAQWSQFSAPYQLAGFASLNIQAAGALPFPKVSGSLFLENGQAKVEKMNLEALTGQADLTDSSLEIPKLTGKISAQGKDPSDFVIKSSLKNFKNPEVFLDGQFSRLDLGIFENEKKKEEKREGEKETKKEELPYKGPEIKASGKISIGKVSHSKFEGQNASTSWNLTGITPRLEKLNGALRVGMGEGRIQKVPVLSGIAPILGIDGSVMAVSKVEGNFNITQGIAKTDDFQINSPVVDLYLKGPIHLPTNKPMDMTLTAKLPKGTIGGTVGEFLTDEEGRATFVFKMKENWKPTLDTSQVQKKAVEKATQEFKKRAIEEGQKLLEGLFRR